MNFCNLLSIPQAQPSLPQEFVRYPALCLRPQQFKQSTGLLPQARYISQYISFLFSFSTCSIFFLTSSTCSRSQT